jgi:hypothetical protein
MKPIYSVEIDTAAREFYSTYGETTGYRLAPEKITEYTHRASILNAMKEGLRRQLEARAKSGLKLKMCDFYKERLKWYMNMAEVYNIPLIVNERSLERVFKAYLSEGYTSLINKNIGNDRTRKVSVSAQRLIVSLWKMNNKPFVRDVHALYIDFVYGRKQLFDKETGEIFRPQDFMYTPKSGDESRPLDISESTVWNYLKDVVNETAAYASRNGNFDYINSRRPKHHRKLGQYSLSKISMDDVALSRKSVRGWVYKYMAVDVVSGYWFRPAYVVGKPTKNTVLEALRNMFCELSVLGLPIPGELDVEHHLIKDMLPELSPIFPFIYFNNSPTSKRAEHAIKALKWGVSKKAGHMRGRWYAKDEAHRAIRNKVDGDYVEPEYQPQTIIMDDLADIEAHNNALHPQQNTYPGMTRLQVFLSQYNPNLAKLEKSYLYRYIGNETDTAIRNNDYVTVAHSEFEIASFDMLDKLGANNLNVTAYWLPCEDGSIDSVYLYQGDNYIGEAFNRAQWAYNENTIERTDEDRANMLHQNKRLAKFDKKIRDYRRELPKVEVLEPEEAEIISSAPADIVDVLETSQPVGYEDEYDEVDYSQMAINIF